MKIKKGDKVKIIAGKDKGKTGKVLQIFPSRNKASIEGLNLLIKHMRPRKQGEKGQRIEFPAPMDLSNMMLVCPKCNKSVRIGFKYLEVTKAASAISEQGLPAGPLRQGFSEASKAGKKEKKKVRVCVKCKGVID